jgi:hypothetical protein
MKGNKMDMKTHSNFDEDYSDYPDGSRIVNEEMYREEMKALNETAVKDIGKLLLKGLLIATGIGGAVYLIKKY